MFNRLEQNAIVRRSKDLIGRLCEAPERHPGRTIVVIGLVFALAYGASLVLFPKADGRIVVGDAVHYYVYLRSVVFDGDLQFHNEYVRLYGLTERGPGVAWMYDPLPTGYIRNVMPVGPAIAWAPLYLVASGAVALLRWCGVDYPLDGFGRVFQASAGFSGIVAATMGAWFAFQAAAALFGARSGIWATLAIWLGSSALYYSLVSPTYSHASSMFANGAVVLMWMLTRDKRNVGRYAKLGALIGFAAMVRWQEATLLALPMIDALSAAWREPGMAGPRIRRATTRVIVAALAALVVFSPQMIAWKILYGQAFLVPQGGQFMRWHDAALMAVLFSGWHGLFTWTPVVALAIVGLVPLWKRDPHVATGVIVLLAVAWYTNAAVADWWAGEAFGSRRFVSATPLFVLGLAALFARWQGRPVIRVGVVTVVVVLNLLLLFQYQMFLKGWRDIAPYPNGAYGLGVARFVVPFHVLGRWLGK
ncbi:MAG: hypothetical protein JJE40_15675 [Vicinamibacteria bacterium]|nr:hypothetical protein [Vicinamibacteria bacterium]